MRMQSVSSVILSYATYQLFVLLVRQVPDLWSNVLATRSTHGYTLGMKTAVSIPNDLFEGAERLARRTRRSRSRLFSDALREYLARHTPDNVTELMDKALAQIGAGKDTFVSSAGKRTLYEIEW
jgi:antitoxin MazE6